MPKVFDYEDRSIAEEIAAKIIDEKRTSTDKTDEAIEIVIDEKMHSGCLSDRQTRMTQDEMEFNRANREIEQINRNIPEAQIPTNYSMLQGRRLSIPTLKSFLKSRTDLITHARRSQDKAWYKGECFDQRIEEQILTARRAGGNKLILNLN